MWTAALADGDAPSMETIAMANLNHGTGEAMPRSRRLSPADYRRPSMSSASAMTAEQIAISTMEITAAAGISVPVSEILL